MADRMAIVHSRVLDGTGAEPLDDGVVLMHEGRFEAVGPAAKVPVPPDAMVIDAGGRTAMPGIIEGHAHVGGDFKDQRLLRLSLQCGITTVCSVSANLRGIALRDAIEQRLVRGGARLLAGCIVNCTNGHVRFRTADGPWEVRKAVREMVAAGADFIKTAASGGFYGRHESCASPNYTLEELTALCDEAHAWGVPVVVHCHSQPGLGYCLAAGVDQIHHGAFIDEPTVHAIRERGTWFMPTLAVTSQRNIEGLRDQPWQSEEMAKAHPIHRAGVRLAYRIGVKLCLGDDYPGGPWWRPGERTMVELAELVACGLTPIEAIATIRNTAAAYGRADELGSLEAGKKADLLLVDGHPDRRIEILQDPSAIALVIKDGIVEFADDPYRQHVPAREP